MRGPPLPPVPHATVGEALENAARGGSGLTLVDAHESETFVSWGEVHERAQRMAAALLELGVRAGERVAIVLPTGRDFMDAFFGTLLAGAVPVPLYPPVRLGRMNEYVQTTARMLGVAGARLVLTDRRVRLLLGGAVGKARPDLGCRTVADLMTGTNQASQRVAATSLGLIQFSSGSTVDPKPVALTHQNLLAQCAALKALMPQKPGTRELGVSWLPLYHDMGLIGCLLEAVFWPGPLVLLPPEVFLARPSLWLRALSRHRGTISPAPNFAYGLVLKRVRDDELTGVDLSHWTYALNGAEPVSAELMQRFCERFSRHGFRPEALMPVYGLSEASLAVTFTSSSAPKVPLLVDETALALRGQAVKGTRALVGVGSPVPGAELEVRGDGGAELPERRVGRVYVRAPFVMHGYFGDPRATAKALTDGWLDTGDLGFVAKGELYLCGRSKDIVIVRGANRAPQIFEEAVEGLAGVRAGCAVAVGFLPPGEEDEALLLLVETTAEATDALAEQIRAAVVERTNIRPHTVVLLAPGTLPRTSSGKLRRREALTRYQAGSLTPPDGVNVLTVGAAMAKSALAFAKQKLR